MGGTKAGGERVEAHLTREELPVRRMDGTRLAKATNRTILTFTKSSIC